MAIIVAPFTKRENEMQGNKEILIHIIFATAILMLLVYIIRNEAHAGGSALASQNANDAVSASYSEGGVSTQANSDLVNLDLSNHSRNDPDLPVATAVAPALVAHECIGSISGAGQGASIGFAFGGTREHEKCNRRSNATVMWQGSEVSVNAGDIEMARRERHAARCILASDPELAAAYEAAGIYCGNTLKPVVRESVIALERERRIKDAMSKGWAGTKSGGYDFPSGN